MEISPKIYQALAIKVALSVYARHGLKVNRAYTPKNMLSMATKITGKKFGRQEYMEASIALAVWIEGEKEKERQLERIVQ